MSEIFNFLGVWLIQFLMLVGLLGLILPIFPGLLVMWLTALAYGVVYGFSSVGTAIFVVISVLALAGSLVDNVLMGAGARQGGASWSTILVAMVAGVVGTLIFPPIGGLITAPGAVLLLEYSRLRDWNKAWQALRGMATGWGLSFVARFAIGLVIMALWWLWVWKG
ncbi:MAG: DUF456 domain-containing protein [Anaerolineales bacterium]|nr:DUF456 domain-containing protein [Anaerolineales bacterium]